MFLEGNPCVHGIDIKSKRGQSSQQLLLFFKPKQMQLNFKDTLILLRLSQDLSVIFRREIKPPIKPPMSVNKLLSLNPKCIKVEKCNNSLLIIFISNYEKKSQMHSARILLLIIHCIQQLIYSTDCFSLLAKYFCLETITMIVNYFI